MTTMTRTLYKQSLLSTRALFSCLLLLLFAGTSTTINVVAAEAIKATDESFALLSYANIDPESGDNLYAPVQQHHHHDRELQLQVGDRPDVNASTNECAFAGGSNGEARFQCTVSNRVTADDGTYADLTFLVNCLFDSQIRFDYRRANTLQACSCTVHVEPSDKNRMAKDCSCDVCPFGFGPSGFSINCERYLNNTNATDTNATMAPTIMSMDSMDGMATTSTTTSNTNTTTSTSTTPAFGVTGGNSTTTNSSTAAAAVTADALPDALPTSNSSNATNMTMQPDPYVINTCTSVDCGFACNGTCQFDCSYSGPECQFCANNPLAPSLAPTGKGSSGSGVFGIDPNAAASNKGSAAFTLEYSLVVLVNALILGLTVLL